MGTINQTSQVYVSLKIFLDTLQEYLSDKKVQQYFIMTGTPSSTSISKSLCSQYFSLPFKMILESPDNCCPISK